MSFQKVYEFEKNIAKFFGSSYAISTDSCTHAIELCLRYKKINKKIYFPKRTYIGVPLLGFKLNLDWEWINLNWKKQLYLLRRIPTFKGCIFLVGTSYLLSMNTMNTMKPLLLHSKD